MLKPLALRVLICFAIAFAPLASVAESITKDGVEFTVNDQSKAQYPELIALILVTESMDDEERQYWFDIIPSMTEAQVDRLYDILETEREKLVALEKKYQGEIKNLNQKHLLEWHQMQIKERFETAPDEMRNTYLPIIQLQSLDKVVISRFDAYDDIPTVALNTIISDYESDEQVLALMLPEYYQLMIDTDILTVEDGAALGRYADLQVENRAFYEAFWSEYIYAKFIRIGADQRKRTGQFRLAQEMAKRVPDILDSNDFEVPADRITRLTKKIEEIPVSDSNFRVMNMLDTLHSLVILLDDASCDEACLTQYQAAVDFVLDQPEALKSEVTRLAARQDGEQFMTRMSFYGPQLSLIAVLSDDYAAKSDIKAAATDFNAFYLPLIRSRLNETSIKWNTQADDESLRMFILDGIDSNGSWRLRQAEFAWYAEFLDHFANGTLPDLADAMERIWNEEVGARRIGNLNLLEGPLLEAQTWSAVQMMVSGQCSAEMGRMESYIRRALGHGQDPNSSAYHYYEKDAVRVLSSSRLTRFNCVGEAQEALARDDWHALLIGLADTTQGAPGYDLPKTDRFYLGGVPDNDVALMEAALKNPISGGASPSCKASRSPAGVLAPPFQRSCGPWMQMTI